MAESIQMAVRAALMGRNQAAPQQLPATHVRGIGLAARIVGVSRRTFQKWIAEERPEICGVMLRFGSRVVAFEKAALEAMRMERDASKLPIPEPVRTGSPTRDLVRLIGSSTEPVTIQQVYMSSGCAHQLNEISAAARNLEKRAVLASREVDRPTALGRRKVKGYVPGPNFAEIKSKYAAVRR